MIRFLAERAARVRGEMDDADKARQDAEALRSKYDEKIGDIEARGQELIRESQQKANDESDRIIKETREKAREMINDAEARIAQEKEQALEDAQEEITQLATNMASRILGREVSTADSINAADEFFKE